MLLNNKGKARKIALIALLATVICAVAACVTCFFTVHNQPLKTAETENTVTEEITAPELDATATAKTSVAIPSIVTSVGTLSGRTCTVEYDGTQHTVRLGAGTSSSYYTVTCATLTGSSPITFSATDAGTYTCTFTLKDTTNYQWDDGTITDKVYGLKITRKAVDIPSIVSTPSNSTTSGRTVTVKYDGTQKDMRIGAGTSSSYYTVTSNCLTGSSPIVVSGTNAGTYTCTFTLGDNYKWSDNSLTNKVYSLVIEKRDALAIPTFGAVNGVTISSDGRTATTTYSGNQITIGATKDWDSSVMTCSGGSHTASRYIPGFTETNAGTYTCTVSLTDTKNYEWSDGTTSAKTYTFTIKKKTVEVPTLTKSTNAHADATVDKQTATTIYNGKAQHFTIKNVTDFDKITFSSLSSGATRSGTDFYATNTNTSGYTVTMSLGSNYCWGYNSSGVADTANKTLKIIINKASQDAPTISGSNSVKYDSKITLTCSGGSTGKFTWSVASSTGSTATAILSATTGDTVVLTGTKAGGTVTVTCYATNDDNYSDSKSATKTITINKKELSSVSFGTIGTDGKLTYTGSAIEPKPTITDKTVTPNRVLTEKTDFTFSWDNNVSAGEATVKISATETSNYTGEHSTTFTISGKSVKGAQFSKIEDLTYDGTAKKPTATITLDKVTLSSDKDFDFSWENNTNAGTATIKITGKGNYSGEETSTFTILAKSISGVKFDDITDKTYTGSAITPSITVKDGDKILTKDKDYVIVECLNNVNVGTATIKIKGKGNYKDDTTAVTSFDIIKAKLDGAEFDTITPYIYDGTAKKPKPTITLDGVTLTEGTDFDFSWENNINVGQGKVIITGINNYEGTNFANFTIRYATINDATIVVDLSTAYTYDGTAKTPAVESVKVGNVTLAEGTDYSVTYQNNINAGTDTAKVIIKGMGTYAGSQTVTFSISQADISTATIGGVNASYEYTGSAIKPTVTVTFDGTVLTISTDYSVTYTDNVGLGTATITVTGTGNYTGTLTKTFIIEEADIANAVVSGFNAEYPYTGNAITPTITVTLGTRTLIKDTDYTVAYAQNTDLGTAVITVTGINNYTGSTTANFKIVEADISTAQISGINSTYNYTASAITPEPTVTLGTVTLVKGTDFTVTYTDNVALGTATITVTGTGNYTGTVSTTFDITEADLSTAQIEGIDASYTYTGSDIEPEPTVKFGTLTLVKDTDYTVTYTNNLNVGTATLTVTGKGNYKLTVSVTFEITEADISTATIEGVDESYTFTGTAIQPTVTVKLGNTTLTLTTEYTVAYTDNVNVGTATITVTGTGNYTGTATKTFEIEAASLSGATVEGLNASYSYTGNGIEPNFTVKLDTVTLVKDTDYTVTYTDNVDVGTATLTVTGTGNYKLTVTKTFDIDKSDPEVTVTFDDYDGASVRYAGTAIPTISYTATFGNDPITGKLSWEVTVLISGTTDYKWVFVPDNANLNKVEDTKFINVVAPDIASLTVSWRNGTQPDLYTSTTLEQVKAHLKVEAILTNGNSFGSEIVAGAYTLVGSWTNTGDKPSKADTYALQVFLNQYPNVPPATIDAVYKAVELTGITYEVIDGATLTTEYTALDGFDTTKIKIIATYNDGREPVEISKDAGRGGYKVVYADNHDCLWYGDTEVSFSYTEGGITKTCTVDNLTVDKKEFDITTITFNDKTVTYNGKEYTLTVSGFTIGTVTYTYVKKVDGEPDETLASAKAINAGVYEVTAHFTFTEQKNSYNYEDIEDITKTLTINKAQYEEDVVLPSLSVDYDGGKSLGGSITVKNLPLGVQPKYVIRDENGNAVSKSEVKNAGTYTVTVSFDIDDENYEKLDPITATFTVLKVDPKVSPSVGGSLSNGTKLSEITIAGADNEIVGTYEWENSEQTLKNGRNVCWYTFTPEDTSNYNVVKAYFEWDVGNGGAVGLSQGALTGIIIGAIIALAVAIIALVLAVRARRRYDDEGFNDEVTEEDLLIY